MAERFLTPVDVLYLHGTGQFGTPSAAGDVLMPPWPSVPAGALRSRMLVDAGVDLEAFARGIPPPAPLDRILGTPAAPGSFEVRRFLLARRNGAGLSPLYPLPQDLLVEEDEEGKSLRVHRLVPGDLPPGIRAGAAGVPEKLPMVPLLRAAGRFKPETGYFLEAEGWACYRRGGTPGAGHLVASPDLWKTDPRLGIALDPATRTAVEGMIYTTSALCLHGGVGFLVEVEGAEDRLPRDGLLRFGGEGRAVRVEEAAPVEDEAPWEALEEEGRFQVVLRSWGLFPEGWCPPGTGREGEEWWWDFGAGRARLAAAAVPRPVVVAGWDLAAWAPKPALRAVPPGAVYWFDRLEGSREALVDLEKRGFWPLLTGSATILPARRPEGFNHLAVAAWPRGAGGGPRVSG